jgi:hypothetical protein
MKRRFQIADFIACNDKVKFQITNPKFQINSKLIKISNGDLEFDICDFLTAYLAFLLT